MIKADLHIHTKEDLEDNVRYCATQLIDRACRENIRVLSITLHEKIFFDKKIRKYAEKKGVLLIRGVEKSVEGRHVLLYGDIRGVKISSFDDIRALKKEKNVLVIAPHPFYPNFLGRICLREKFFENSDVFDAIEIQQFYTKTFNPNKKAIRVAKKLNMALVANSDAHHMNYFSKHYTLIDLPRDFSEKDVFDAIKLKKTKPVHRPMSLLVALKFVWIHLVQKKFFLRNFFKKI